MPRLSLSAVVPYLLERGFLDKKLIVGGDVSVEDVSRRNRNFRVESRRGPCLFLKQASSPDAVTTLAREASVCRSFANERALTDLRPHLPRLQAHFPADNLLILEGVRRSQSLRELQTRKGVAPVETAMTLGRVMAGVHKLAMPDWGEAELQSKPPWILSISRPEMGALSEFSMGQLRIIAILQRFPDFGLAFDELRRGWRNTALIHYDIKWDNVLIARRGRRPNAMIIDWELAGPGDPCWDIGSELSSYLNGWLGSIPATRDTPPERLVELARHPLTGMQPSMAAFWDAYAGSMGIAPDAVGSWKVRSVRYAAARLVQTVYERMQSSSHLSGNDVCALQVSLNMLRRPEEALVRLLGIPL